MLPKDQDLHNLHTPDPAKPAVPTTAERVAHLEKRIDFLENTIMSAIRDLSMNVNQMHRTQLNAIDQLGHGHVHQEPPAPQILFTFLEAQSANSMYRVYQDGPDHPICPNQVNIHTRRDDEDVFDAVPVDPIMVELLNREFAAQVGQVPNKVYYVEVHRLTDEPVDETSVSLAGQSE